MSQFNISSLADKCAWSENTKDFVYCAVPKSLPDGVYPDDWYKGTVSTNDQIEKINYLESYLFLLSDLSREAGENIDVENIKVSKDAKYLIFNNKLDQSLWLLDISS